MSSFPLGMFLGLCLGAFVAIAARSSADRDDLASGITQLEGRYYTVTPLAQKQEPKS